MYAKAEINRFSIDGPVLITPKAFADARGLFSEVYRAEAFNKIIGQSVAFAQDNLSISAKSGTVRGLHAQKSPHGVGKLVQCLRGSITDIAVDARKDSPTYGQYVSANLSESNRAQLWVPEGFLHGYATLCDDCLVYYKQTGCYAPNSEISIMWNDPDLAIDWKMSAPNAILSDKDACAANFAHFKSPFA